MDKSNVFALYGNIIYTPSPNEFTIRPNHFLICENGIVVGYCQMLPEKYRNIHVYDYSGQIIIPGLCDTHTHAPQYAFRGLGMDSELIEWLNTRTFPEETLYSDLKYAQTAYTQFADALKQSATTRAAVFATVHVPATLLLMQLLEGSGVQCLVGKVNMNRNSPDTLCDDSDEATLMQTEEWITESLERFQRTKPIITPRFALSCTDKLLSMLGELAKKYRLPVQSHLSESKAEIQSVKELFPCSESYGDVYRGFNLFGGETPTVMAHCVHSDSRERQLIKDCGVLVSHCPSSNINLSSGIAPIRQYLSDGISVALGTDIAAGFDLSVFRAMTDAIRVSKLHAYYSSAKEKPLSVSEAFYLGTKGASPIFGKVGSFETGYEFDAVVLDDRRLVSPKPLELSERLERIVYLEKEVAISAKFVSGKKII